MSRFGYFARILKTASISEKACSIEKYGEGLPHRLFIGGLAYHPKDYELLAEELNGTNIVVDNPMHTGKVRWNTEWLRSEYMRIFQEHDCDTIVAHSLGNLDAVELQKRMSEKIRRLILLTPPLHNFNRANVAKDPRLTDGETTDFGLVDRLVSYLCTDMDDDEYRLFLQEHHRLYGHRAKQNYKEGMPKEQEIPRLIHTMIDEIASMQGCSVLAIIGGNDIWAPGLSEPMTGLGSHTSVSIVPEAGHYVHRVHPEKIARTIRDWES